MRSNKDQEKEKLIPYKAKYQLQVDQGWAWMVLFGSGVCCAISLGIPSNIGVLYVHIQTKLNISLTDTSLIGSIQTGCLFLSMFITSPVAHLCGCRVTGICGGIMAFAALLISSLLPSLYVYYACIGVITGIGSSMAYSSGLICLNEYFVKRRSLAFLIFLGASGFGVLAFGPLMASSLDGFGIDGTVLILAAVELNMCVGSMLFFPFRHSNTSSTDCQRKTLGLFRVYLDKHLWTRHLFYLILSAFFYGVGYIIVFTLLPEYMVSNGFPLSTAALSITAIGITTTCSRFILGFISDRFQKLNLCMYICSGILSGTCSVVIIFCLSIVHYMVVSGLFGIFYGSFAGLLPVVIVELMGSDKFPPGLGIVMMAFGVGNLLGSPIAVVFLETTGRALLITHSWNNCLFVFFGIAQFVISGLQIIYYNNKKKLGVLKESISIVGVEFVAGGVSFVFSGLVLLLSVHYSCCSKGTDYCAEKLEISESEQHPLLDTDNNLKTTSYSTV